VLKADARAVAAVAVVAADAAVVHLARNRHRWPLRYRSPQELR